MKSTIRSSTRLFPALVMVLGAISCTSRPEGSAPAAKPLELKSRDVLGYVAIPSLNKALKEVSAIVNLFAPGKVTPEMMKSQIGAMLGDPTLENLDMERPLVVLLVKGKQEGAPPAFAVVVPAKKSEPYTQALTGMGMQSLFANGLLLVGIQGPEALAVPATLTGTYEQIASARIQKTGRLYVHLGDLMDAFRPMIGPMVDQYLQMFQSMAALANGSTAEQSKSTANLLQMEVKGLLSLLNQCEVMQVDLDLGGQSIGIDQVFTAKPGTALHGFMSQSSRSPSPSTVLPEGERFLAGALRCDSKSLAALVKQVVDEVAQGPEAAALKDSAAMLLEISNWWGGLVAFGMGPGKQVGFTMDYDMEILDEAKYLEAIEKGLGMLAEGGALSQLYAGMGLDLKMKFEKAVREHAGTPVHRWNMAIEARDPKSPMAANLGAMKAFMKDVEIALIKKHGLMSSDGARLDAMIDQVQAGGKKGPALKAQKTFGAGRQGYFDYDLIGLLKVMQGLMPESPAAKPMKEAIDRVKSTNPMIFAITFGSGSAQQQVSIPLQPFVEMMPK